MSNLDDFFKKRDKKKKVTTKSKFSTIDTEELAKNLEASTLKCEDFTDPTEFSTETERVEKTTDNVDGDGEWKPFDSDENKDYTGLRISTQTWQEEDVENELTGQTDENTLKASCPWGAKNKTKNLEKEENDEEEEEKDETDKHEQASEPKTIAAVLAENTTASNVEAKTEPVTAPTPGAYIPPSMRARMQAEAAAKPSSTTTGSTGAYVPPSMRGKTVESSSSGYEIPTSSVNYRRPNKAQPNLNDCLEFPSLDATNDNTADKTNGEEKFEYAKKSGRVEPKSEKDRQINLQNKFASLSGNQ